MLRPARAFTLLELLLVIAIVSVLAGIIIFSVRPAEILEDANSARNESNAKDIEKAIRSYIIDNGGNFPSDITTLTSTGYYDICQQGESTDCINIDDLVPDYISSLPLDSLNSSDTTTGFKLEYDDETQEISVMPYLDYINYIEAENTLTKGLRAYWKMDEASWDGTAGEVIDSSGNNNNGSAVSAVIAANSRYGNTGTFNGTTDYLTVPNNSSLNFTKAITVASWIYSNNVSGNKVIASRQVGADNWSLWYSGNQLRWRLYTSGTGNGVDLSCTDAGYALSANGWFHVAGTWDGANSKIYVNGEECATQVVTGDLATEGTIRIGNDNGSTYMNGRIDETRIYNRSLNSNEMNTLYLYGPPPEVYYAFDEGTGAPSVLDSSGNNGNGTMGGTLTDANWVVGKYGNALDFDGSGFMATTNNNTIAGQRMITVSMWLYMRTLSGTNQSLYTECMTTCTVRFTFGFGTNNKLRLGGRHDDGLPFVTYVSDNRDFPIGEWVHVAVVYDSTRNRHYIYMNGEEYFEVVSSNAFDSGNHATQFPKIGSNAQGLSEYMDGKIDEFKVYYYVRNQDQILKDMGEPL